MTVKRLVIAIGAVLLPVGLVGLLVPVQVCNSNGGTVGCGNDIATDLSGARAANDRNGADIPILNQIILHTDSWHSASRRWPADACGQSR